MAEKDWTELFSPIVLSRGRNFYAVGKVKQVTAEDSGLEVTVHDQVDQQKPLDAHGSSPRRIMIQAPPAASQGFYVE